MGDVENDVEIKTMKDLGPDLANKNTTCLAEPEFLINNQLFISICFMQYLGYNYTKKKSETQI